MANWHANSKVANPAHGLLQPMRIGQLPEHLTQTLAPTAA